ncbi:MAG: alpha/beta hydrolase [bacterium]|nr:alpha/beta hydrolase [bacterium]
MPFLNIEGHRIFYREAGRGRPLFLLHGVAGASGFWSGTLEALSPYFRCLAPDLLGFGDSDKPKIDYAIARHRGILKAMARALRIDTFDLIGHSMGGTIALDFALSFPGQVRRLILINTPISGKRALHGRGRLGATRLGLAAVKVGLEIPWVLWVLRQWPRYNFVLDPRFTADARKAPLYSLKSHVKVLCQTDLSGRLHEVSVPVMVMGSDEDGIVRPDEFVLAAGEIRDAKAVWIGGVGHCPTLEKPEESHRAILDYLMGDVSPKTSAAGESE